jgi:hypothetical protein
MDTGRWVSPTILRQANNRLFNHSVHLSSISHAGTYEQHRGGQHGYERSQSLCIHYLTSFPRQSMTSESENSSQTGYESPPSPLDRGGLLSATIPTSLRCASISMSRLQRVLYRLRVTVHLTPVVGVLIQFHRRLPDFRHGLRAEVPQGH